MSSSLQPSSPRPSRRNCPWFLQRNKKSKLLHLRSQADQLLLLLLQMQAFIEIHQGGPKNTSLCTYYLHQVNEVNGRDTGTVFIRCLRVCAQRTGQSDRFKTVKSTDFKFDVHISRDSPYVTPLCR